MLSISHGLLGRVIIHLFPQKASEVVKACLLAILSKFSTDEKGSSERSRLVVTDYRLIITDGSLSSPRTNTQLFTFPGSH